MSLRIKLFQFLTSIMDIVDTVQDSFLKRRKNSTNLNTGNNSYKILKNLLQRKMLKQIKKERLLHQHKSKGASQHERQGGISFHLRVDKISSGNLFHVRVKV